MYRIDNTSATGTLAAPTAPGPNPNSYFTGGNPSGGVPATVVDAEWLNAMQEEMCGLLEGFGVTLDKSKRNQLYTLLSTSGKVGRIRLQADTTFYLNAATGSDANNGLTTGTAWATLQHAWDTIAYSYDLNGFKITLQLADGTYPGNLNAVGRLFGLKDGTKFIINGNAVTPANVIVTGTLFFDQGSAVQVQNFNTNGASITHIQANALAFVNIGAGMNFGGSGTAVHMYATTAGIISINSSYTVSGSAQNHVLGIQGGTFYLGAGVTITLTGTPAFSGAFVALSTMSNFYISGAPTLVGTASGNKFTITGNSVLNTNGFGPNNLPGSVNGTTATGGQAI